MAVDLIAEATKRRIATEQRVQQLRSEIDRMETELAELQRFLDMANRLARGNDMIPASAPTDDELSHPSGSVFPEGAQTVNGVPGRAATFFPTPASIEVRADAWVGKIAKFLLENGPHALPEIVSAIRKGARPEMSEADFTTHMNSAIWRRKDLFKKDNGKFDLLTQNIKFVGA